MLFEKEPGISWFAVTDLSFRSLVCGVISLADANMTQQKISCRLCGDIVLISLLSRVFSRCDIFSISS